MLQTLIIDDNENNIEVLKVLLAQQGAESQTVLSTRHVKQAVEAMDTVDVIFVDIEFPNGSGFDVLKVLRADPRLQDTPIIAYSVHTSEIEDVRAAGFDGFLGKPLHAKQFPDQLRRILNRESVWEV
jgi:two-component system cell cycle response regulator DivK